LQLIDHDDALIDGTGLRAFIATSAVLVCDIVEPIGSLIKALIGTFQPTERTLGAEVETDHGALILRRAAFEGLVARLALRPQLEMAFDSRNRGAFHELEPFWQNRNLMLPFNSLTRLHCPYAFPHFVIRLARSLSTGRLFRVLMVQIFFDSLNPDDIRIDAGDGAKGFLVREVIPENPKTAKTEIA